MLPLPPTAVTNMLDGSVLVKAPPAGQLVRTFGTAAIVNPGAGVVGSVSLKAIPDTFELGKVLVRVKVNVDVLPPKMVVGVNAADKFAGDPAKVIRYCAVKLVWPAGTVHSTPSPLSVLGSASTVLDRAPLPVLHPVPVARHASSAGR